MGKGSRREREYVELCKQAGMATYRPATVQYGENDPFGLFDVFALSPSHSSVHAVQVKSNRATGITAWARHTRLFRELGMRTYYAIPYDREGWRIVEPRTLDTDGGNEIVRLEQVDERAMDTVGGHDTALSLGDGVVQWLKSQAGGGDR